jgi:hypothetical protein
MGTAPRRARGVAEPEHVANPILVAFVGHFSSASWPAESKDHAGVNCRAMEATEWRI